jgi:hypothetical protein
VRCFYDGLHASELNLAPDHPLALRFPGLAGKSPGSVAPAETVAAGFAPGFAPGVLQERAYFEVWEVKKDATTGREEPVLTRGGYLDPLTFIPAVAVNLEQVGNDFEAVPPRHIQAIADAALEWFRVNSAAKERLRSNLISVIHRSGHDPEGEDKQDELTPRRYFWDRAPEARMQFVDGNPEIYRVGFEELKRLEDEIDELGDQPLLPTMSITQQEAAQRAGKAQSRLQWEARRLVDALELAMDFTMQWMGLPPGSGGSLVVKWDELLLTQSVAMGDVLELGKQRFVGRRTVVHEARRRAVLDPERTVDEVIQEVEQEMPDPADMEARIMELEARLEEMRAGRGGGAVGESEPEPSEEAVS